MGKKDSGETVYLPDLWSEIMFFNTIKFIITSKKALSLIDNQTYCFMVHPKLCKSYIKTAIEKYFNVRVLKVNISNLPQRKKKVGKNIGFCRNYKKAIVTLNYEDKINLFSDI